MTLRIMRQKQAKQTIVSYAHFLCILNRISDFDSGFQKKNLISQAVG